MSLLYGSSYGQEDVAYQNGQVSYISSQNVYVRFENTRNINIGDTLYVGSPNEKVPLLVVVNKSTITCICSTLEDVGLNISDNVFALNRQQEEEVRSDTEIPLISPLVQEEVTSFGDSISNDLKIKENPLPEDEPAFKQNIKGRIAAASYNNISGDRKTNRMQYTFLFNGDHLGNSRFSINSYMTFRHEINEWQEVKDHFANALKVYSFALKYDFDNVTSLTVGRKINPRMSNMGAMDGIQFEKGMGNFKTGLLVGSRPDLKDYSLNPDLFQYGAYLNYTTNSNRRYQQSTISYIEQRNNWNIDRRLIYIQHSNSLLENLTFFGSSEITLYENINNNPKTIFDLSNLYLLLRYRPSHRMSISASYDNRKNIIYYESYKSFIERLIDEKARQGLRLNFTFRIHNTISLGLNSGWRFQESNWDLSKNLNGYLTFSRIPLWNMRVLINANFLQTQYLNSRTLGIRAYKDLFNGKLNVDINFRIVDYTFSNYEMSNRQSIPGINFSLKLNRKLGLYIYYEGIFDNEKREYNRINTKLIKRF